MDEYKSSWPKTLWELLFGDRFGSPTGGPRTFRECVVGTPTQRLWFYLPLNIICTGFAAVGFLQHWSHGAKSGFHNAINFATALFSIGLDMLFFTVLIRRDFRALTAFLRLMLVAATIDLVWFVVVLSQEKEDVHMDVYIGFSIVSLILDLYCALLAYFLKRDIAIRGLEGTVDGKMDDLLTNEEGEHRDFEEQLQENDDEDDDVQVDDSNEL